VADDFSERYGGLLTGSYDCVDRIVLNAYFPLGHNPGGLRCWSRRLHGGDEHLDDTHLMRMAGRFARRVKAWAGANGVPVIYCKAGQRKHLIAEEYLATHEVSTGVFLILAAKAPAGLWKVNWSPRGVRTDLFQPQPPCGIQQGCPVNHADGGHVHGQPASLDPHVGGVNRAQPLQPASLRE
jgi:hypothetical protein